MPPVEVPLYKDLAFWSLIVAILAFLVSVTPYVWRRLRPVQLRMEIGDLAHTMHFPAGSVLGVFLSLSNTGTRPLRVSSIVVRVSKEGGEPVEAKCVAVFPKHDNPFAVTFLPVFLRPDETWGGFFVNFTKRTRDNEKKTRQLFELLATNPADPDDDRLEGVRAKIIGELKAAYAETLSWSAGDYTATFLAHVDGRSRPFELKFGFFLHESEVDEIRKHADDLGSSRESMISWPTSQMKPLG
ncbi:hypothetical protein [Achromobacter ruhlandii]|uniref:hypothetical protein n=1 Tax=Achromobacter ruhlandii TaxID=72557 RepID=UPI000B336C1C|nr:hypothetical protein [Achromobacter ruhlandii]